MLSNKLRSSSGLNRTVGILLILVAVMLVIVAIPAYHYYRALSAEIGCMSAMDTAKRQLTTEFLLRLGKMDAKEGKEVVTTAMLGYDDICPGGGNVYLLADGDPQYPFRLICGLHDEDKKLCTRMNGAYVKDAVAEELKKRQTQGDPFPASVPFSLNGKTCEAVLVEKPTGLRRGTASSIDYTGVVAFYGLAGYGDFAPSSAAGSGKIAYFCFADEEHGAVWTAEKSWTGDAWSDGVGYEADEKMLFGN